MLDMTRNELASAASVMPRTIADFERGDRKTHASTIQVIQTALETAGVVFSDGDETIGPGVHLRDPQKK